MVKPFCFVFFVEADADTYKHFRKKIKPTDHVTYYLKNNAFKSCNKSIKMGAPVE